jgi:hypothetical protein
MQPKKRTCLEEDRLEEGVLGRLRRELGIPLPKKGKEKKKENGN